MTKGKLAVIALFIISIGYANASDNYTVNHGAHSNITAFSECRKVTNNSATNAHVYVPTQTDPEWESFYTRPPAGVTIGACATLWKKIETHRHTCGITADDTLECWGYNEYGETGNNTSGTQLLRPTPIYGGGTWIDVDIGQSQTCGIKSDGSAWCWGRNQVGQLGNGNTTNQDIPVRVSGTGTWIDISAGTGFSCGIKTGGTAWCWGSDAYGNLGNNSSLTDSSVPVQVSGTGWTQIEADSMFACGIKSGGTAWCWGYGNYGQMGNGTNNVSNPIPVQVSGTGTWTSISVGSSFTCGVKSGGTGWCWGLGGSGRLGTGNTTNRNTPGQVSGAWKKIEAGSAYACGIKTNNTAWCWGENENGELGIGSVVDPQMTPVAVSGGGTWKSIVAGLVSCGIKSTDIGYCWSRGGWLGAGDTVQRTSPTQLAE